MSTDPVETNPEHYSVVFENDRVRVLAYTDEPGASTQPHAHPDSVMVALSDIHRKLVLGDQEREVQIPMGTATWLPAQTHSGHNIGTTPTHSVFVELKEAPPAAADEAALGPEFG